MELKKSYNYPAIKAISFNDTDVIMLSGNPSVEDVPWYSGESEGEEL